MAIRGLQSNEWLQNPTKREFRPIEDIQRGLQLSQITVSILQAINRIRCRRVIDEYGNCKSSKVYLLIPHGEEGEEVLNGICTEMALMQLHEWKFKWNDINSSDVRTNFKEVITNIKKVKIIEHENANPSMLVAWLALGLGSFASRESPLIQGGNHR